MIVFDPQNPFPLLPEKLHSYAEEQEHSILVDDFLGMRVNEIENELVAKKALGTLPLAGAEGDVQETWIGLSASTFLTPYTEIRTMLAHLNPMPGASIIDLGAGYGRMGLVIAAHYPEVRFLGYEFLPERTAEARRFLTKYPHCQIEQADLSNCDFSPAPADIYFIYDFGNRLAIEKILFDLQVIAKKRSIIVVGRGRGTRDAIERRHFWLCDVVKPEHYPHYSIYRAIFEE